MNPMALAPKQIICSRCGKPVDRITEERSDFLGWTRITVECHGERQTEQIDHRYLEQGIALAFGKAFTQHAALPQKANDDA